MIEVFTVGGGEYLVNTFNALAAWSGSGGYKALVRVVMVMGFAWALLMMAWNMDAKIILKWFMQSTLMYMVMMVPTVTVKITDRTNPNVAGATVANVPVGIGLIAGFTSQISDYLTRSAETVFVMPAALNYSTGGIIYGAKLMDATQGLRITDPVLAVNLNEHFKQCVFYEVLMGSKTMDSLLRSPDMLASIGPGSVALSQQFVFPDGSSSIETCQSAYTLIASQWNTHYNAVLPKIAAQFFPGINAVAAQNKLTADLGGVGVAGLGGSGTSAQQLIRQAMFINAMTEARDSFGNSAAQGAVDSFAQTRADIQTRNTYSTIAAGAMKWVPLLNVVLTVVFYAMFPIVFLLMLLPVSGPGVAKGYIAGFFYLAAWGPLFAVLNMIFMSRWSSSMVGWQDGGLTAANFAGVSAINQDAGSLAGYMIMSVPFIAAGMAKGAMSISSHSASFLAPSQNAAEQAASEQTTGNYSYGNAALMNRQINTLQQDQLTTAPMINAGAARAVSVQGDGGLITANADGSQTYNAGPGLTQSIYAMNTTQEHRRLQQEAMSEGRGVVEQKRAVATESVMASTAKAAQAFDRAQHGISSETSEGRAINDSISQVDSKARDISDNLQRTGLFNKAFSDIMGTQASRTGNLNFEAALGVAKSMGIVSLNGKGSLASQYASGQSRNSDETKKVEQSINDAVAYANKQANTDSATHARDTFYRKAASSSDSELRGLSNDTTASLAETRSATQEASRAEDTYRRYSKEVQDSQSNGFSISQNEMPDFQRWWETIGRRDDRYWDAVQSGWHLGLAQPNWAQSKAGTEVMKGYSEYKLAEMRRELGLMPQGPEHHLKGPAVTTADGVRKSGEQSIQNVQAQAPAVNVARSAHDDALSNEVGERLTTGKQQIDERETGLRQHAASQGLEADRTKQAVAERQKGSLYDNISFDGDFRTPSEDQAHNAPRSASPVNSVLPAKASGMTTYGRARGGTNQVGTPEAIGALRELGESWQGTGHQPVSFGDISQRGGGDMPGHKGHEHGAEVDVRPFRKDGKNAPVTWQSGQYDRDKTRQLVQMARQQNPGATVLFNDPVLIREGLTQAYDGHDNHLHLRLPQGRPGGQRSK